MPPALPPLTVDGVRLAQVLRNLTANAIRHTLNGEVRVRARLDGEHLIAFDVTDSGTGIHPADHDRIFEPFVRLGGEADSRDGGLGLPLARRLARRLGGDVTVRSALGDGSTFTATVVRHTT